MWNNLYFLTTAKWGFVEQEVGMNAESGGMRDAFQIGIRFFLQ
jgi:hypothetical protein